MRAVDGVCLELSSLEAVALVFCGVAAVGAMAVLSWLVGHRMGRLSAIAELTRLSGRRSR